MSPSGEKCLSNIQGFWYLKIPPFFPCHVAEEKRAGISNHVKNRVLESCSIIFFTLLTDLSIQYQATMI